MSVSAAELPSPTSANVDVVVGDCECACVGESVSASVSASARVAAAWARAAEALALSAEANDAYWLDRLDNASTPREFAHIEYLSWMEESYEMLKYLKRRLRSCPVGNTEDRIGFVESIEEKIAHAKYLLSMIINDDQARAMKKIINMFGDQILPEYFLHYACKLDSYRCVRMLLDLGFDPFMEDSEGLWPYEHAPEGSKSKKYAEDAAIVDFGDGYSDEDV